GLCPLWQRRLQRQQNKQLSGGNKTGDCQGNTGWPNKTMGGKFQVRPIPVLMYHHVTQHKGDMITVTPEVFDGQMRCLIQAGYRMLSVDELASYIAGELILEQKAV